MNNRAISFIIVTAVYILALIVAIAIYQLLPFAFWLKLLLCDIAATILVFIFSLIFKNASVYDPYWSVQPIAIVVAFALHCQMNFPRFLLLAVVCLWGIRLTANWAYTFKGLKHQDWRYTMLKEKTGKLYPFVNFCGIHLVPTLVVYGCILPVVFALSFEGSFNLWTVLFALLSLGATILQGVSDYQMHKFKRSGQVGFIRTGLWKHSRHPNYLGEILMWWGVALAVFSMMPSRVYLLVGAVLNTLLFLFISIPLADNHQARKEGFEAYRSQTRALLRLPKLRRERMTAKS